MEQTEEIWKKAVSSRFPDHVVDLEVSDSGKVRKEITHEEITGKLLNSGYRVLRRKIGNEPRKDISFHALVAETFIGPRIEDAVIDHKNACKTDNRAVNLQYLTLSNNSKKGNNPSITEDNYKLERIIALKRLLIMLNKIGSIVDKL